MENNVVYDRLDDVLSAIEYNGGGGISELKNKGCVKSVQRGVKMLDTKANTWVRVTPISSVDLSRAVLILCHDPWGSTLNQEVSWQVIEFD